MKIGKIIDKQLMTMERGHYIYNQRTVIAMSWDIYFINEITGYRCLQ